MPAAAFRRNRRKHFGAASAYRTVMLRTTDAHYGHRSTLGAAHSSRLASATAIDWTEIGSAAGR